MTEPSASKTWDVFISYSSKDGGIQKTIKTALEAAGIRCWVAPDSIPPGETYVSSIIDGIQNSKVLVLALSKNSNVSRFCRQEVERANALGLHIIPMRIEKVEPSKEMQLALAGPQWLEAFTGTVGTHIPSLVAAVTQLLGKPARPEIPTSPPPPRKSFPLGYALAIITLIILAFAALHLFTRENPPVPGDPPTAFNPAQTLQDLQALAAGTTNAAARLLASVGKGGGDATLMLIRSAQAQDAQLDQEKRAEISRSLLEINRLLQTRPGDPATKGSAPLIGRPRVVTLLPMKRTGDVPGLETTAANCTKALLESFAAQPGFLIVDRAHLEDTLREHGLNLSALSDEQARIEVGKLLPASLLIASEISQQDGKNSLSLRLIDTATARILSTPTSPPFSQADLTPSVGKLAADLGAKARRLRPLEAPLLREGDAYVAGLGAFHGVDASVKFQVVRLIVGGIMDRTEVVGEAAVLETGGAASTFNITWSGAQPPGDIGGLLIRERPAE